jgi:hypothetical protein
MSPATPVELARAALSTALDAFDANPASPHASSDVRRAARNLPPGAWSTALWERMTARIAPPRLRVGAAVFPAIRAGAPPLEVRVDVRRRKSATDDDLPPLPAGTRAAVEDALAAARAYLASPHLQDGRRVKVEFSPVTGWEGGSCGLAVALAAVSAWMDAPLLPCVWATGRVAQDGQIDRVGGVRAKRTGDRELVEPADDSDGPAAGWTVSTLGAAVERAIDTHPAERRAARVRKATQTWLHAIDWHPEEHVATSIDATLLRWWRSERTALRIGGLPGAGCSWRLAALAEQLRDDVLVLALRAPVTDNPAALARAIDACARSPRASATLGDAMAQLAALARALPGPPDVLLVVDDPGDATEGTLLTLAREEPLAGPTVPTVRLAWTRRTAAPAELPLDCLTDLFLSGALLGRGSPERTRARLPAALWVPENRGVLETTLAMRLAGRLRDRALPHPLLRNDLLTELCVAEQARAGDDLPGLPPVWAALAEHAAVDPAAPWYPFHTTHAVFQPALDRLVRRGVLSREGRHYRIRDPLLAEALPVAALRMRLLRARSPDLVAACLRSASSHTQFGWSPTHDELARAWIGARPRARSAEGVAHAVDAAWTTGALDPGGPFSLAATLARADLLAPDGREPLFGEVLGCVAALADGSPLGRALPAVLAAGMVAGVLYDTWPLCYRRRGRAAGFLAGASRSLRRFGAHDAALLLDPLTDALNLDVPALLQWFPADPADDSRDRAPSLVPVLHLALFPTSMPAAEDLPEVFSLQERFSEAWWTRQNAAVAAGGPVSDEAREEAGSIARDRLLEARARGDALGVARWEARQTAPDSPVDPDLRWLLRSLYFQRAIAVILGLAPP